MTKNEFYTKARQFCREFYPGYWFSGGEEKIDETFEDGFLSGLSYEDYVRDLVETNWMK